MFHNNVTRTGRSDHAGPHDCVLKWSYATGDVIRSSPVLGSAGQVYGGSEDNRFYALGPDGALLWSYDTGYFVNASAAISSGTDIFIPAAGLVFSFESSGSLKWSYSFGSAASDTSSPALGPAGEMYVGISKSDSAGIYARIDSRGSLEWSYTVTTYIYSSPALGDDNTVYVGSGEDDGRLYAFLSNGTLGWSYYTAGEVNSTPDLSGGHIYFGSGDQRFYALDSGGSFSWSYVHDHMIYSSPAIGGNGEIYYGCLENNIFALNPAGTLSWSFSTASYAKSSPAVDSNGTIFTGSDDYRLYAIRSDGSLIWSYATGGEVSSSPAIGLDGNLYAASNDHNFYAFEVTPAPTATPTATPINRYIGLTVAPSASGGYIFSEGDRVTVEWRTDQSGYGFAGVPCLVYLVAVLNPAADDTAVSTEEIATSEALYLFDSRFTPLLFQPGRMHPTYTGVVFPASDEGSEGSFFFIIPPRAKGRWAFAGAVVREPDKRPIVEKPVIVSTAFIVQ